MAIELFGGGQEDVLIGTDVASKGLDFPNIQHVINYDMPKEIENYSTIIYRAFLLHRYRVLISILFAVHRIGRTGRSGKTGVATTFVNKQSSPVTLLDLRALLIEAKQRVPEFLAKYSSRCVSHACSSCSVYYLAMCRLEGGELQDQMRMVEDQTGVRGCALCGGFGHRITNCPKAQDRQMKQMRSQQDREKEFH